MKSERPVGVLVGVELNVALLSPTSPDAEFLGKDQRPAGPLSAQLSVPGDKLGIRENWYGLTVEFGVSQETVFWTYPIQTVSQSENGFELTYQSTVVLPHWSVRLEPDQPWTVVVSQRVESHR